MPFIEAPTTFYLGRRYDPRSKKLVDQVVYYDLRDLTTHAVVVGMTGSGKTGLCIDLLEEAVLDNIPSIIIDPKGDITNLLLSFPDLSPADFQPWVNIDDARRAGQEPGDYAADVAARWREGLKAWDIVPDRVKWLRYAAQYSIYTPGSDSGLPVSILDAMQAPAEGWIGHEEAHRERISGMVKALLALVGKDVEPVKDREHVLISNIFEHAWMHGEGLTLEDIIIQVQQPPFEKLGVFDVDKIFPEKDRFKLALELNNIIASPSFQTWLTGEPLDIQSLLYRPDGRPKVSIFYIAHLNDAERQFIITLLLENMLAWMRTLSGTTSLRALLYIDEVYGMFPPYPKNPPTKDPMIKLLKQARAYGLGLILATQNPGDLDYKGLSNAGTWFIGKLQTENDKKRVLSGLESLVSADSHLDMDDLDGMLSQLDPRVFVMHNVHNDSGPQLLHTRWAMSYLRGPLTRSQVSELMAPQKSRLQQRAMPTPGSGGYLAPLPTQEDTGPVITEPPVPRGSTPLPPSLPEERLAVPPPPTGSTPMPRTLPEAPAFLPQTPAPGYGVAVDQGGGSGATGGFYSPSPTGPTGVQPAPSGAPPSQVTRRDDPGLPPGYAYNPPVLPSSIVQYFLPNTIPTRTAIANWEHQYGFSAHSFGGAALIYRPFLLAQASVRYMDRRTGVNTARQYAFHVPDVPKVGLVHWETYIAQPVDPRSLAHEPFGQAIFADAPVGMADERRLKDLQGEVVDQVYHSANLTVLFSPTLKVYSDPDASRRDFRVMLQSLVREKRDAEVDKVTKQYEAHLDRIDDKLRKETRELDEDRQDLSDRKREQLFTAGEAALSLFKGRTTYTLSRYSRTQRFSRQAHADVRESEQEIAALEADLDRKVQEMEETLRGVNDKWGRVAAEAEEVRISPYKKDIALDLFGVGWIPFWFATLNGQAVLLPAHPIAARGPQEQPPQPPQQPAY